MIMKTLKTSILSILFLILAQAGFAQTDKSEKFKVAGVCGMCKKKIETAAKGAGATFASWNPQSGELEVKYKPDASSTAKIQQAIAGSGYDTPGFKATEASYNNLHECCKYERSTTASAENCCSNGTCTKGGSCCSEGKCTKESTCCKGETCTKACCTKS